MDQVRMVVDHVVWADADAERRQHSFVLIERFVVTICNKTPQMIAFYDLPSFAQARPYINCMTVAMEPRKKLPDTRAKTVPKIDQSVIHIEENVHRGECGTGLSSRRAAITWRIGRLLEKGR